jgi:hypothetical protein
MVSLLSAMAATLAFERARSSAVIPWENLDAYQRAWDSFRADPEWRVVNENANREGHIFQRTRKTLLRDVPSIMARLSEKSGTNHAT